MPDSNTISGTGVFTFEEIELTQSQLDARAVAKKRSDFVCEGPIGVGLVALFFVVCAGVIIGPHYF